MLSPIEPATRRRATGGRKNPVKIVTGSEHFGDKKSHEFDRVTFEAADGNSMFEVSIGPDGRSIEVRGIESCKVDKMLFSERLLIEPHMSNSITIRTKAWKS